MAKFLRFSKYELVLIIILVLLISLPLYMKMHKGWNPLDSNERNSVTVIRMVSPKTDSLNMEKYQVEGVVYATATNSLYSTPKTLTSDLWRFDQCGVRITTETAEDSLIDLTPIPPVAPAHSFNERILLVTGRNNTNGQ